jgi:hypothetical protein
MEAELLDLLVALHRQTSTASRTNPESFSWIQEALAHQHHCGQTNIALLLYLEWL